MDDKYQLNKKPYLPPRLVSVAFKVEDCFTSGGPLNFLIPLGGNGGGASDAYSTAANSGSSFWDSDLGSSSGTEGYNSDFEWNW